MKIDDLVKTIPEITASFYDAILIGNEVLDEFYNISYTGDKVKVSSKKSYDEFLTEINKYNINLEKARDINDERIILISSKDDYKIIFLIKLSKEKTSTNDKKTIIFADDSKVVTNYFKKIFDDTYNIIICEDGEEVIKVIEDKKDSIDGLFLDLQMPKTNGYQVLDYFRDYDLFDVIPVSIMSGEDGKDNISEIIENYKIVDMIQKPFDKKSASSVIEKTINFKTR